MKDLLMSIVLLVGICATASAEPMGHFHRSPSHHGHHHHHHSHLTTREEQKPMH